MLLPNTSSGDAFHAYRESTSNYIAYSVSLSNSVSFVTRMTRADFLHPQYIDDGQAINTDENGYLQFS